MEARKRRQVVVISLVLAAHVLVDLVLLVGPGEVDDALQELLLPAWPMAQCSLIALWAGIARLPSYARFPLALLAATSTWLVTMTVLGLGPGDWQLPESEKWALMLAVQALAIVIVTTSGSSIWGLVVWWRGGLASGDSRSVQYGIGSLLLWGTSLALTLGLGKAALAALGWTPEAISPRCIIFFFPLIGVYNAAYGLLILLSLLGRRWLLLRCLVAWMLVGLLGWSQLYVLDLLFEDNGATTVGHWLVIAVSQALYLYATLVPLRLAGCFGVTRSRTDRTAATARESGNPFAT